MSGAKILVLDIETSPTVADVWALWDQTVSLNQIHDVTKVICFAAKWAGEKKIAFASIHSDGREAMIRLAHELLDEADIVIHYNGTTFDLPHLRREFLLAGLTPPSPVQEIDLLRVVKSRFRFVSNKLDHVAQQLGLGGKTKHEGHELWTKCLEGDPDAWRRMERYNRNDVTLTEKLYNALSPWIKTGPNVALFNAADVAACNRCGDTGLAKRGFSYTATTVYQRYRCDGCGAWSRDGKALGRVGVRGVA